MRFTDFLRTTVLLFSGAASTLALCSLIAIYGEENRTLLFVSVGFWVLAILIGLWLGRGAGTTAGIARLLRDAKATTTIPVLEPGAILLNRLWSLAAFTVVAGGLAFLFPPVPVIGTGYALAISLAWRRQSSAVQAIEERDGIQFHVERSGILAPTQLVRTAGLKRFEA
jgi:hypothetical protein